MKKRILALALAAFLTLPLTACEKDDTSPDTGDNESNAMYDYDLTEYITVDLSNITVRRTNLDKTMLEQYNAVEKCDIYGGSSASALPTEGITVANGDTANIDYVGTLNGVAFAGGTAQGHDLTIGSNTFIDGFEAGLVGAKVGETKALELKFPDQYQSPELAGKNVIFTVTVNYIKRPITPAPEYNEENVKRFLGLTISELEASLIGTLAFDELYTSTTVKKYPEKELKIITDKYVDTYNQYAESYGMTLDSFITANGSTTAQFYEYIDSVAKQYVKRDLLAFYIVSQTPELEIKNYETEAKAFYDTLKADGSYNGSYEDFVKYNDEFDIMTGIYSQRVVDYLATKAKITEAEIQ